MSPTQPYLRISTPAPGSFTPLSSYEAGSEQTLRRAPSAGTRPFPGRGGLGMNPVGRVEGGWEVEEEVGWEGGGVVVGKCR